MMLMRPAGCAGWERGHKIEGYRPAGRPGPERHDSRETRSMMTTVPITLHVDPEAARAYESMTDEERNKIEAVLSLNLRGMLMPTGITLRQAMDELGQEAEANGLTPEILESILRGEDDNG